MAAAKDPAARARQLANLVPIKPGEVRNPNGRPKGVTYPGDWIRGMLGLTEAQLKRIAAGPKEPISRRMAAASLLRTLAKGFSKGGTPKAMADLELVLDRTEGKATQAIKVEDTRQRSPGELLVEARRIAGDRYEAAAPETA